MISIKVLKALEDDVKGELVKTEFARQAQDQNQEVDNILQEDTVIPDSVKKFENHQTGLYDTLETIFGSSDNKNEFKNLSFQETQLLVKLLVRDRGLPDDDVLYRLKSDGTRKSTTIGGIEKPVLNDAKNIKTDLESEYKGGYRDYAWVEREVKILNNVVKKGKFDDEEIVTLFF